jgi:regulator of sigma E protease
LDSSPTPDRPDPVNPQNSSPPPGAHAPGSPSNAPGSPSDTNGPPPPDAPPPDAPPLTPGAWLMNNGPYLVLFAVAVVWLYRSFGLDGLWRAMLVVLGLGFVIFIHELGHFLAAKWCDVHVTTFSLGFGPALPGCSWQRGETTYKIAVLPLGGYVSMVGEGMEAEEEEDYPRSFKNKTVGQRMLIISAGVIMNVLFGFLCFILVYRLHGVERPAAIAWTLDAGSPAWQAGVRTPSVIEEIGSIKHPYFDDLKMVVALSGSNERIHFLFDPRTGEPLSVNIKPRRDYSDKVPVIGVSPPSEPKLAPARFKKYRDIPALYSSPAAFARETDLKPGDVVLGVVAPEDLAQDVQHDLARRTADIAVVCKVIREAGDRPVKLRVLRAGESDPDKAEEVTLEAKGFQFGDVFIGTTNPDNPTDTFAVAALPPYPDNPSAKGVRDPYEFRKRMIDLAGKPVVIQVQRKGASQPVNVLVPPAYHVTFGMHMKMGEVAAVRDDSPASKAGLIPARGNATGDVIARVEMSRTGKDGEWEPVYDADSETRSDPLRLRYEMESFAASKDRDPNKPVKVRLTVLRPNENTKEKAQKVELAKIEWDDSWRYQNDKPIAMASPTSVPGLGVAYRVESTVAKVLPGSPAARAGIQVNDRVEQIAFRKVEHRNDPVAWERTVDLESERVEGQKAYDEWPHVFTLLQEEVNYPSVKVWVHRAGQRLPDAFELTAEPDPTWPQANRGYLFISDLRLQKADTLPQAVKLGMDKTGSFIAMIYLNLRSLVTGRVSAKTLGGPLEIAAMTFDAAEDPFVLLLWLGIISVNLAVVNFLPIPLLDGGHMVFLIYEKLRGKPASEAVRNAATIVGLAMILSLMVFVFYLDIMRRVFGRS